MKVIIIRRDPGMPSFHIFTSIEKSDFPVLNFPKWGAHATRKIKPDIEKYSNL
ncbi:hypothetical protein [Acidovorax sp. BLS4]|uniref:hypothetical protein n=1 Tax=Acidovorax sp. BLS4 TaxID=3273430 RepID=UPI002943C514|nr:hypothetical protein [Paracidovorax avenae]WOI45992.1 hypothetical protein R1Z03_01905 [Paracidovorax avenae]